MPADNPRASGAFARLSVVHVARAPVGGVYRHIADLASAQRQAGHQVGLICDSSTGGAFEAERIAALAAELSLGVVRLPMPRAIGPADIPSVRVVAREIHRRAPDVIHAHGAKGGVYGRLAAIIERRRGRRLACFYAPHGGSLHYEPGSLSGRIYFTVERALERATDGLIHVSAFEAGTYRQKVGAPRCPAHVVVNGVRPEEFETLAAMPDAADFLFIGALRDLKGADVFIDALARLAATGAALRACIVGSGEAADEARYRRQVGAAGLADRVTFLPPMPAREAFRLARTVVIPSRAESMPYIVLEAAAACMPMIATRVGGIPEVLQSVYERLIPPGDAAALAAALGGALSDPGRMRADAILRQTHVRENFSLARMAARIEGIYQCALHKRYSSADPIGI